MATAKKRTAPATSSKKATTSRSRNSLRLTKRVVNGKRHTTGYMAGKRFIPVSEATRMAKDGLIRGVMAVGGHIQSSPGQSRLTDLPQIVE
jgi:hypothetical protein